MTEKRGGMQSEGETKKPVVHVYTDGACSPNPGVGGWAAILVSPGHDGAVREITGAEAESTNNRMEIQGAIEALSALKKPCHVMLHTDSQYLKNAFTNGWLKSWQRNGWKTAAKKPVLNQDLWMRLLELSKVHTIEWLWVRGHSVDPLNNRCDELAVEARVRLAKKLSGRG